MANSLLTPTKIANEMLLRFKNNLGMGKDVDKQYSEEFAKKGAKIGDTVTIRKPNRFTVSTGATLSNQDVSEESTTLQISNQKHVAFRFTSSELTLNIDKFGDRYLDPAGAALANQVDVDLHAEAKNIYNLVGSPGTVPASALVFLQAGQKLDEFGCPMDNQRYLSINPAAQAATVDALKGLFQSSEKIAEQYEKGRMGKALGFDWRMAQNIYVQTVGPLGGTPLVNGAGQTGSSLVTDGWTAAAASRLKQGDVFTIASVYAVNPITGQSTGSLQQFVVTADVSSDGSGNATIDISPSIVTSGATKNVSAGPADNAAITVVGTASTAYAQNLAFHKNAISLACVDLEMPGGLDFGVMAKDEDSGLAVRVIRQYDIANDRTPCRVDIMYGIKTVRPEWACRITA